MRRRLLILIAAALASGQAIHSATPDRIIDTREAMIDGINPAALGIWTVSNRALSQDGTLDPVLMDTATWARLTEAARMLQFYARQMAEADTIRAGGPDLGGGEVPQGVASREEIQAMIDADPQGFRAISRQLADRAGALAEAARQRDAALAGKLTLAVEEPCQSCHLRYWYKQ